MGTGEQIIVDVDGFTVRTDQPVDSGGKNEFPDPFNMFLVGLVSCSTTYAHRFCKERGIDSSTLSITMNCEKNSNKIIEIVNLKVNLPKDFPEKYKKAIVRAIDLCSVKKQLLNPPKFEVTTV